MNEAEDTSLLLPVRPDDVVDEGIGDDADPAFESPEDAGVDISPGGYKVDGDELVSGPCDDDDSVTRPQLLPSPKAPSAEEVELHNATHLPYRNWCPWCVAGRRKKHTSPIVGQTKR